MMNIIPTRYAILFLHAVMLLSCSRQQATNHAIQGTWAVHQAHQWQEDTGWLIGANFIPSTAINQLEMWQDETFDPTTIYRELEYAANLGFNAMRVYLHDLLWKHDSIGFLDRIEYYLEIADGFGIKTMFVLLDGVWNPYPKIGKQPDPTPHVHNSGWVQSPGIDVLADTTQWDHLEDYIKGVISHFADDGRVVAWDIYNEPDNTNKMAYGHVELINKQEMAFKLLKKSFEWARQVNPSQPITSGLWYGDWSDHGAMKPIDQFMANNSDVISFHCYEGPKKMLERISSLRRYNKPIICTEYLARPLGSTFLTELHILKELKVGGFNWGLVAGKTQTIYHWDSWEHTYTKEPEVWFCDIFRPNGMPYDWDEADFIFNLIKGK
jgi:hypothetical protein